MALTLAGADIRHFYAAIGITLPDRSSTDVSIRCFANPDAHAHGDRKPSTSVSLVNGAWYCHGCGARGSAFDAAVKTGHATQDAFDLLIDHGLLPPDARLQPARALLHARPPSPPRPAQSATRLRASERDVRRWQDALAHRVAAVTRICRARGWSYKTMRALGLGWDRGRITIPIRAADGELQGVLRYQPTETTRPKMLATAGSRLGLIPHPATEPSPHIVLTEGPPDMIAARSRGIPAIAIPGTHAWQDSWTPLLAGRMVTIVMDADPPGRIAARRIADSLASVADVQTVDLSPSRADGYDLTDWLAEQHRDGTDLTALARSHNPPLAQEKGHR